MNECCNPNCSILLSQNLKRINSNITSILCAIESIPQVDLGNIERMLAHNNPMTIAGSYPHVEGDRYIISTTVRFLDMLNTDMYLIYKTDSSSLGITLPIYFKDADYAGSTAYYEHAVVLSDGTPVTANQLIPNGIYKAKYQYSGSYIILDSLTPLNPNIIPV